MYMICIPWKVVFVDTMTRIVKVNDGKLTFGLWLVLIFSLILLSSISFHLIEKPAREWMKLIHGDRATQRAAQSST